MLISIITPTFNSKKVIEDCLLSFKNQNIYVAEHIIIDGGSNDDTCSIVKNYSDEIVCVSEPDHGIYDALNKGIKLAKGDIIGILHSDDIFAYNNVLTDIVKLFKKENVDSVYSDLVYVYKNKTDKVLRYWKSGEFSYKKILNGWMPPHPTFFVKREIFEKYGNYDLNFKIAADYDLILRFLYKHKISTAYLPKVTVKMRIGGASNRSISNIIKKSKEDYKALKKNRIPFPFKVLFYKNFTKIIQFF